MPSIRRYIPLSRPVRVLLVLAALCFGTSAAAASLVITPAMGSAGSTIKVRAEGLSPSTSYTLEFVGSPATNLGSVSSSISGRIDTTRVLPSLPAGGGKMRLKTGPLVGTVVAATAFTALPAMSFTALATTVHAGQRIRYRVQNYAPGTLTLDYEGLTVAGPITVSGTSYAGQFAVPTDRPPTFPANAQLTVTNRVGRVIVNRLQTTLAVQPPLLSPISIGITAPPPNLARSGQRFNVSGALNVAANEEVPEQVSLWYFGDNGDVFPLGAAEPQVAGSQGSYSLSADAPGRLSMTAGQQANGQTALVGTTNNTYGRPVATVQPPQNAAFDALPEDRWRIRVRVLKPGGAPVVGAIVLIENAPVAEPSDGGGSGGTVGSIGGYLAQSLAATQLQAVRATDDQGCPLSLARKLTDVNGWAEFEFDDEDLAITNVGIPTDCVAGGSCNLSSSYRRSVRLGIDASAQGHGFQFTEGPNAFDFLPHIYEVSFNGAGDGDPANDETQFVDWYQDVLVLSGGRDVTFPLTLPPITPKVALFDLAIVPWVARSERLVATSQGQAFAGTRLAFGPVNSQRNVNPAWIVETPGQEFPTQITVRTDPAVSGIITPGNAKLYLDANRNGTPELVGTFSTSNIPLNCSIDGLDKSQTWRANLPAGLKLQAGGRIGGYVEFIGTPNSGQAKQRIAIDLIERNVSWLAANKYSQRKVYYGAGGQRFRIEAVEDTTDADIQLQSDPGYDIGRLRNETENQRLINVTIDGAGNQVVEAPLDGAHEEAGRPGAPTLVEPALGVTYGPEVTTLIDQSFPLFYYVWGVPLLAGIEVGADFTILAEIGIQTRFDLSPAKEPLLTMTTTPSLDLGLNFYLDLDVLFDLVDGGVDLDAIFELDMPIRVVNGVATPDPPEPDFTASLLFSWHFEVFCLPLDVICDAINDIEGCERLLPPDDNRPCFANAPAAPRAPDGGGRPRSIERPLQTALAYSPTGAGFLAFTRDDSSGASPPVLVLRPVDGGDFGRVVDETIVSTAPGIRSVAVEFYLDNRAVVVWAESADSYATLATRTPAQRIARQRLMYSLWNGEAWSAKAQLTPVSGGEGGVDLAACTDPADGCPAEGEVLATWTRDMAGDITQHRTRVYSSRYLPSRGWTTAQAVDGAALLDSAPSAAFVDGVPVVAFVRSTNGVFADTDARRIAYRFLQAGAVVQVPAGLPGGVAWPSIVALPTGGFAIAHTHANDPRSFVGNTQRAALAYADACAAGACAVVAQAVADGYGRPVYGERPTALLDEAGNLTVVMRGTGFGAGTSGSTRQPGDPLGMVAHSGELIAFAAARGQGVITPLALSNDGAAHFAPAAAYDPELGQVVAAGTRGAELPQRLRDKLAAKDAPELPARAAGVVADANLTVYSAEQGVDFAIEQITATSDTLSAGDTISVSVRVRNIGADYVAQNPAWRMLLTFDAPFEAGGSFVGGRFVPSLASGAAGTLTSNVTVPAGFSADQPHRLYARLFRNNSVVADVNNANDQAQQDFGGMPMPFGLAASAVPGTRLVQLTWAPTADPAGLIAGYRIWFHDGDGQWRHLGSSFELGFLDLAAPLGVERHYRVTSYSARTIESAPSDEAVAKVTLGDGLFANGFE